MAIQRMTQNMMTQRSITSMQTSLNKLATTQEQLSTGRMINRPSDDPSGSAAAMRTRTALAKEQAYQRNAQDADSWMTLTDSALGQGSEIMRRVKELAVQANSGTTQNPESRSAIATEIESLRAQLLTVANTKYLERPIFGGITAGSQAYDANGDFVGQSGAVKRTIGDGVEVQIDANGPQVFAPDAAGKNVFAHLADLATAVRTGDSATLASSAASLDADANLMIQVRAGLGATHKRIEDAMELSLDAQLRMTTALSTIENTDLPKAMVDLKMQETAYQAALQSTARVIQPSLMDFLR